MNRVRSIVLLLSGALAGATLVISCGDNWHLTTDASIDALAVVDAPPSGCDCPATEPPLAGRVVVSSSLLVLDGHSFSANDTRCPTGSYLLTGSCTTDPASPIRDVSLGESGFYNFAGGWACTAHNNEATPVTIRVFAVCIKPAP